MKLTHQHLCNATFPMFAYEVRTSSTLDYLVARAWVEPVTILEYGPDSPDTIEHTVLVEFLEKSRPRVRAFPHMFYATQEAAQEAVERQLKMYGPPAEVDFVRKERDEAIRLISEMLKDVRAVSTEVMDKNFRLAEVQKFGREVAVHMGRLEQFIKDIGNK